MLTAVLVAASGCGDDSDAPPPKTPTPRPSATPTVAGNQPPVLAPLGARTVVLGGDRLLAVTATDPDGDPVTLSAEGLPYNSYFLPASGVFCIYADDPAQVGQSFDITFTASDGSATASETLTLTVVQPDAAALAGLAADQMLQLAPIGNRTVEAGRTLALQITASGADAIVYKLMQQAETAPLVTFDGASGQFRFATTAAQAGRSFEFTFQACKPADGGACDPLVQQHETIHVSVVAPMPSDCPDYPPQELNCQELQPDAMPGDLPQPLESCYVIRKAGTYTFEYVNILDKGALYFAADPSGEIDVRVKSLLVEKGGVMQAGSPECPFGAGGGTLSIGLYGDDPSHEGSVSPAPVGIRCMTAPMASHSGCFPEGRDPDNGNFYCTTPDSDDPCSSPTAPDVDADNFRLEHYGDLNFDSTPWGYKVLGVSYGGSLRLFGAKGVKPTADDPLHCEVPTAATLDAAEMQAWADLTYSSWARLEDLNAARTQLTLDRRAATWAVGDEIVVGTTDWYPSHSELRTITAVSDVQTPAGMRTQLTVAALDYPHVADIFDTNLLKTAHGADYTGPVSRTAADLRAVVGLLSRSITIRSLGTTAMDEMPDAASCTYKPAPGPEQICSNTAAGCPCGANSGTDPSCYFGGHVMFRQGFRDVQLQGVEFHQLGQGGRIGHYPVHWHMAKSTAYTQGRAFLKDSSVWDSMTRFVTVHGTHNVALQRNVGFLSVGHGYYVEDGSEINNLFCHNLGVGARAALKEYYVAQAQAAAANPSAAPPWVRYVPPILDGADPQPTLMAVGDTGITAPPALRTGSDSYMPVMFWSMNAYNEFVGNAAVGVHGFGSCYWLLGSGVSGPSADGTHQFAGLANYNRAGAYQAPLLRFRGNSCTTATYALAASAEISPAAICEAVNTGYTPIQNPYVYNLDGTLKPLTDLQGKYSRPAVVGNFQPIQPNASNATGCAAVGTTPDQLLTNREACVTTLIDRFTTSFNWAQVNYGSIWLRPWYYLLLNPAVTDQLFGGVTFVTAGSWLQVPPAYFSLAKNGLFVGVTQHGGSEWAARSGPKFSVAAGTDLGMFAPCNYLGKTTCNLVEEGVGYWTGGFQPKRLINIYDGPHFADDNLFLNVGAWQCDPQPCLGKQPGQCVLDLPCGIYTSTIQPAPPVPMGQGPDPHKMIVLDAGIGWKQPNGFYYPPAFTYRAAHFFKTLPTGLPDPDPANPLNQCFSIGAGNDFMSPTMLPGDCRHNAVDRTAYYIGGNMIGLNGGPATYLPQLNQLPTTPIDFSTIIVDLDASLTGASGTISGVEQPVPTTSVSRNPFFDAPAQSPECLSFGVQTTPYQAVTTNVAPLKAPAASGDTYVEPWTYTTIDPITMMPIISATSPVVALYRQWETSHDSETCNQVCNTEQNKPPDQFDCSRGTFMTGPNVGHATYLTLTHPPGLGGQPGAAYYIDTSTDQMQPTNCIRAITGAMKKATFDANGSYVVYNLFARNDAVISYQLYVGDSVPDGGGAGVQGRYVRVHPHLTATDNSNGLSSFRSQVVDACDPASTGQWCSGLPKPAVQNGVLTLTLDQRPLADDYLVSAREDYDRCMPRDMCYFDVATNQCQPCVNNPSACIRQGDFLAVDLASMNQTDATGTKPLDVVCQDWATYASGTTTARIGELSLVDCPASGCLGFAFTLPGDFNGNKTYAEKGLPLAQCFAECAWSADNLVERMDRSMPADPLCGAPRMQTAADYCSTGTCN